MSGNLCQTHKVREKWQGLRDLTSRVASIEDCAAAAGRLAPARWQRSLAVTYGEPTDFGTSREGGKRITVVEGPLVNRCEQTFRDGHLLRRFLHRLEALLSLRLCGECAAKE